MDRPAFFLTCTREMSCGYLAQDAAQISRNALASGLCDDMQQPWASALRLMNHPG